MDEIYHNVTPLFTEWVIGRAYLHEPFIVIDVGVQGGPHVRWQYLGSCARAYGFDPISEVIESLEKTKEGKSYFTKLKMNEAIRSEAYRKMDELSREIHDDLVRNSQESSILKSEHEQIVLIAIELVGHPCDLMRIGAMDEPFAFQRRRTIRLVAGHVPGCTGNEMKDHQVDS